MLQLWQKRAALLCLCCFISCCYSLNHEGKALLKFRERVESDPYGALDGWREDHGVARHCSWRGVHCSPEGFVVILNLRDLCLEGTLAPEIANLVHLKSIILRNNSFTGIIPGVIGKLNELELLDLGNNNFVGPLPPDIRSSLSSAILLLDNNELLGGLSSEIDFQVDELELSTPAKGLSCIEKSMARKVTKKDEVQKRQLREAGATVSMQSPTPMNSYLTFDLSTPPPPEYPVIGYPIAFVPPPVGLFPPTISPAANAPGPASQQIAFAPAPVLQNAPSPTINIAPMPPISSPTKSHSSKNHTGVIVGGVVGALFLLILIISICLCVIIKATVKPWATGLSGQLQKAFVAGVPKLKRSELEAVCEDFSNVIGSFPMGTLYKGTLSSRVEIVVACIEVSSAKHWSNNLEAQFRKKVETLSKVNHKNFVNLLGYCQEDEPFSRMMVFEYAPNGTLFEHLHIKESEHLDWKKRLRIAMGIAYCLEHMQQLNPPLVHNNLNSSAVYLTEDYAAKISDFSFSSEAVATDIEASRENISPHSESNVYSFGALLFEMLTGRLPHSVDIVSLEDWASDYFGGGRPLKEMVDPTLDSFEEEKLERIGFVIRSCASPDSQQRPTMREVTSRLREITGITSDAAIPKLSPSVG